MRKSPADNKPSTFLEIQFLVFTTDDTKSNLSSDKQREHTDYLQDHTLRKHSDQLPHTQTPSKQETKF